jgi:hypothetical protein
MIGLSQSTLGNFSECARCFWLAKVKKVERPRGIFPSLPKGMDRVMKEATERELAAGMPIHYLEGIPDQPHPDRKMVNTYRKWQTFQSVIQVGGREIKLWGELDELLIDGAGKVSPYDYKSKGDAPAAGYTEKYYQSQADVYDLLLFGKHKTTGFAYFTYTWPVEVQKGVIRFDYETVQVQTNRDRAAKLAYDAAECLDAPMPEPSMTCEMCHYIIKRMEHGA